MSTLKIKRENGKIFCPLADSWHIETPEEKVRQEYIKILVEDYGYSLDQMAQEIKVNNSQRGLFLLGDFTVFPVLIKRLLVACYLCQFPLFCSYQIVQSVRLAFFDWSGIDLRDDFRVGNSQMYLMLYSEQNSSLQPFMLD